MFGGGISYDQPISSGKRISGFAARKDPGFSLGWDQSNQMNSYQLKKGRGQEVTSKITAPKPAQKAPILDEALERQKLQQLYEKLAYQNPDIPPEQLEYYVRNYDQQRRVSQREAQIQSGYERRAPIKQKDSMRDIIYNGVGVESMEEKRAASRRNNSNLVLGDGYNYFQENNKR